ncbi:LuxR C-terminal-related transcriptional regulator [Micromonospora sp. NPDC048898]|uniref:LuxR C-terminal-related transcriptional regulator n=1 Tax=Micromonospora sp. NPDC048898 TaxID=3364260 RepID=UPI00371AFA89
MRSDDEAQGIEAVERVTPHAARPVPARKVPPLNVRDAGVLEGVASGASSVQLAASLFLSRQGVEYRIGRLLRKFRVTNRTALVGRAYSLGIFESGSWPPKVRREFVAGE